MFTREDILKNVDNQTIFFPPEVSETVWLLTIFCYFFQNILLYVQQKKETHTSLEQFEDE